MELITGASAEAHISALDDAAIYDAIIGGSKSGKYFYVMDYGDNFSMTTTDDGFQVGTGVGFWYGRAVRQSTIDSFVVPTEGQSGRRIDVFGLHFTTDPDGTEHCDFKLISGIPTSGTPVIPDTPAEGDLSKGAPESWVTFATINVNGPTFTVNEVSGRSAHATLESTSSIAKNAKYFLDNLTARVLDAAHPVGSIVWLANSNTPSGLGYPGTWQQMTKTSLRTDADRKMGIDIKYGSPKSEAALQLYSITTGNASQSWVFMDEFSNRLQPWLRTA